MSPSRTHPGEFEQMTLLAILRLGAAATAVGVLEELDERAGRSVARGALYRTLDRMEEKGWVEWEVDESDVPERGGRPRRRFRLTGEGLQAVRDARAAFARLEEGLEDLLGGAGT